MELRQLRATGQPAPKQGLLGTGLLGTPGQTTALKKKKPAVLPAGLPLLRTGPGPGAQPSSGKAIRRPLPPFAHSRSTSKVAKHNSFFLVNGALSMSDGAGHDQLKTTECEVDFCDIQPVTAHKEEEEETKEAEDEEGDIFSCEYDPHKALSDLNIRNGSLLEALSRVNYGSKDYWDKRYDDSDEAFEWLLGYDDLRDILGAHIDRDARILVVGCGNSDLPPRMERDGFTKQVCVDNSDVVIAQMKERFPSIEWQVMDAMDMSFENASFDVILDKGCIDGIMCTADSGHNCQRLVHEYHRVLRTEGICLTISLTPPEKLLPIFTHEDRLSWLTASMLIANPNYCEVKTPHSARRFTTVLTKKVTFPTTLNQAMFQESYSDLIESIDPNSYRLPTQPQGARARHVTRINTLRSVSTLETILPCWCRAGGCCCFFCGLCGCRRRRVMKPYHAPVMP
jgi:ubiquinone/menaquinone biosynthesis C-methylase UbiE